MNPDDLKHGLALMSLQSWPLLSDEAKDAVALEFPCQAWRAEKRLTEEYRKEAISLAEFARKKKWWPW